MLYLPQSQKEISAELLHLKEELIKTKILLAHIKSSIKFYESCMEKTEDEKPSEKQEKNLVKDSKNKKDVASH